MLKLFFEKLFEFRERYRIFIEKSTNGIQYGHHTRCGIIKTNKNVVRLWGRRHLKPDMST